MSFLNRIFQRRQEQVQAIVPTPVSSAGPDGALNQGPRISAAVPPANARPRIWAVGGGKGGVGKSLVAANMGILLAKRGKRVVLVDVDLGAANLHTVLGMDAPDDTLSCFLKNEVQDIRRLIKKTGVENLEIISGAKDSLDVVDFGGEAVKRLKDALSSLDRDYVLLDIGPGTSANMLDLFLMADEGMLVTTPMPTSIENTYRFLKCLFLRRIKNIIGAEENTRIKELLKTALSGHRGKSIKTVTDIIGALKRVDGHGAEALKGLMGNTRVSLIVNFTETPSDREIGPLMEKACMSYFSVEVTHLGDICDEWSVNDSIRLRRPLALHYGRTEAARAVDACLIKLISSERGMRLVKAGA
ncbi:MAG: P-loop NTPase, partial [Deltaproteobacteria bacterium]|nr:P-loop NTPase [Deltaproteobacteria bacterium]